MSDEDWVKKCMEYRVECRRPVKRPRDMVRVFTNMLCVN